MVLVFQNLFDILLLLNQIVEKNSRATVLLVVEDKVRPNVKVITNELGTDIKLANVRYKLTGKGLAESGKTVIADNNGELTVNGLSAFSITLNFISSGFNSY